MHCQKKSYVSSDFWVLYHMAFLEYFFARVWDFLLQFMWITDARDFIQSLISTWHKLAFSCNCTIFLIKGTLEMGNASGGRHVHMII